MFRPIRRAQVGGDYTDIINISTNINAETVQADIYTKFLENYMTINPIFYSSISQLPSNKYENIMGFPLNVREAREKYDSTLSTLSTLSISALIAYKRAEDANISSTTAKAAASTNYIIALEQYKKYSTMYAVSSGIYSSMWLAYSTLSHEISSAILDIQERYNTYGFISPDYSYSRNSIISDYISTFNNTYSNPINITLAEHISTFKSTYPGILIQEGGAISTYTNQAAFDDAVRHLEANKSHNTLIISTYNYYSTIRVPKARLDLSTAEAIYRRAYTRSTNDTSSGQMTYKYNSTLSSIKFLSELIENETTIINNSYAQYIIASNLISANTYLVSYSTAVNNEGNAYKIYNSTVTMMKKIETLYSMTLDGLSIPTSLISSIGIQSGGGIYNPSVIISTLQCVTSNTNCNKMSTFLSKYIKPYFTLSTALPTYYNEYTSTMKIREYWDGYTPQYVSTLLINLLSGLDNQLSNALTEVSRLTSLISEYEEEQTTLNNKYNKSHLLVSTSIFTGEEINMLLRSGGIFYMSENVIATTTTTTTSTTTRSPTTTRAPTVTLALPGSTGTTPAGTFLTTTVGATAIVPTTIPATTTIFVTDTIISPFAMAKDTHGNVFVTSKHDNGIYRQNSFTAVNKERVIVVSNGTPHGIAIDSNNVMYVMVKENNPSYNGSFCINVYDANLRYIRYLYVQTADYSYLSNFFSDARYITVDSIYLYVIDIGRDRICRIPKAQFGSLPYNAVPPIDSAIPFDSFTTFYINNPLNVVVTSVRRTAFFSSTYGEFDIGKLINGRASLLPRQIPYATHLAIDSSNTIYAIGGDNSDTVYSFTETNLTPVQRCILPSYNITSFMVSLPNVYYIDPTRNNIQVMTIQSGGQSQIPPLIQIPISSFSKSAISTQYAIDMNAYHDAINLYLASNSTRQQDLINSIVAYQSTLAANIKTSMLYRTYVNQKQLIETSLNSVSTTLTNEYNISSILSTTLGRYNIDSITGAGGIQALYAENASTIIAYKTSVNTLNAILLNQYTSENSYYSNVLKVISSYVKVGLFQQQIHAYENRLTINPTNVSMVNAFTTSINTYMNYLKSEYEFKTYYVYNKMIYEHENANIASGVNRANLISRGDYNRLKYNYDLYVAQINTAISYRKTNTPILLNSLYNTIFPIFNGFGNVTVVPNILEPTMNNTRGPYIKKVNNVVYFGKNVSSMVFNSAPLRVNVFTSGVDIPTTTVPNCDAGTLTIDTSPLTTTTIEIPTTTVTSTVYGIKARYIKLTKSDGNFEILQIIAIDHTGKNVAFNANVTVDPTEPILLDGIPEYITNGRYTSDDLYNLPIFKQTEVAIVTPSISSDTYVGIEEFNLAESYTAPQVGGGAWWITPVNKPGPFHVLDATSITIDLGATYDLTAITYLKYSIQYNPIGLTISILDETSTELANFSVAVDNQYTTFDLRLDKTNINIPVTVNPVRYGVCGLYGRYIRMAPSINTYRYSISQITVVSSNGTNLALNKKISAFIGGVDRSDEVKLILNGIYNCLPVSKSFTATSADSSDYILIDLGSEYEINAVNIYYSLSDSNTYAGPTDSAVVSILTEDYLEAASQTTTLYHLVTLKEILDFHNSESAVSCPITLYWPPYYGVAGIICRYVKLFKTSGELAFSKIEIIDKTGLDVAQFGAVTIVPSNPSNSSILNGVADYHGTRPKSVGYASGALDNQSYIVDFRRLYEVCCIRLYGCSNSPNLSNGIIISLHDTQPYDSPLVSYTSIITTTGTINSFDTRYEPVNSSYPTTVKRSLTRYGLSGTFAQSIRVYGGDLTTQIIDSTGTNINIPSVCISSSESSGGYYLFTFNNRMYEINSVITSLEKIQVELYDCYGIVGSNKLTIKSFIVGTASIKYYADFRKQTGYINRYAPIRPLLYKQYGSGGQGIIARYIKIFRRDAVTPLYISQILAIDENGRNCAYAKESVCVTGGVSSFPPKRINTVDGFYEAQIDTDEFLLLFFQKYKRKSLGDSFETSSDYYAIDLKVSCAINSIIYVCPEGRGKEGEGVIIQLIDSQFNVVATQMVSYLAKAFGVDILDFRHDPTIRPNTEPNYIEVAQRPFTADPCGVHVQYVRIEQTQPGGIQLSQVLVLDISGYNYAHYKPTYANSKQENSYRIVDGNASQKDCITGYCSDNINNAYIEINLGQEYSVHQICVTDIYRTDTTSSPYNSLTLKIYNSNHDLIGSLNGFLSGPYVGTFNLITGSTNINNLTLSSKDMLYFGNIGVQAADQLMSYKYNSGAIVTSYTSTFSTMNIIPPPVVVDFDLCTASRSITITPFNYVDGGVPTRYVRVYNVNNYIQISQIMVYNANGINVAYKNQNVMATSNLPGRYPKYATDGYGGFFHGGRDEPYCFISENNRYDYWEIDLGSVHNIIAVNYVPPLSNKSRNIGTRIQLLNQNRIVLDEVNSSGGMIDFRDYTTISITQPLLPLQSKVSPIILTALSTHSNPSGFAFNGTDIYVGSNSQIKKHSAITSGSSTTYDGGIALSVTGVAKGMCTVGLNTYCAVGNRIINITNSATLIGNTLINPYSLDTDNNGNLYISENRIGGKMYRYSFVSNTLSAPIYTRDNMQSISVISSNSLVICVGSEAIQLTNITGTVTASTYIANSNAFCNIPGKLNLSGIANDSVNNIRFVSDVGVTTGGGRGNTIYAIMPNGKYTILAGTGIADYTGNNMPAFNATMNGPYFLVYNSNLGGLFVSESGNNIIRMINLNASSSLIFETTTSSPNLFQTTTILGTNAEPVTPETSINNSTTTSNILTPITSLPVSEKVPTNFVFLTDTTDTIKFISRVPTISQLFGNSAEVCHISKSGILYICMEDILTGYTVNTNGTVTKIFPDFNKTDLGTITSITSDNNNIYIVSAKKNTIYQISITGNIFGTPLPFIGSISTSVYVTTGKLYSVCYYKAILYFTSDTKICWCPHIAGGAITTIIGGGSIVFPYYNFRYISNNVRPSLLTPTSISLVNPHGLVVDSIGNLYFTDSATNTIYKFVHSYNFNTLYPITGPLRNNTYFTVANYPNPQNIPLVDRISQDIDFNGYTINIKSPFDLTFDSNMNLICTSLGSQIYRIKNLEGIEPIVEVIAGFGIDTNNLQPYNSGVTIAKYANLNNPTSICYSPYSNSFIFIDSLYNAVRQFNKSTEEVLYKGNNGIMPYGYLTDYGSYTESQSFIVHQDKSIYYVDTTTLYKITAKNSSVSLINSLAPKSNICIYNQTHIYFVNSTTSTAGITSYHIANYNIITNTLSTQIIQLPVTTAGYINICIHENGCILIQYEGKLRYIYLKANSPSLIEIGPLSNFGPMCLDILNNLYIASGIYIDKYALTFTYTPQPTLLNLEMITTNPTYGFATDGAFMYYCDTTRFYAQHLVNSDLNFSILQNFSTNVSICCSLNYVYVTGAIMPVSSTSSSQSGPISGVFRVVISNEAGTFLPNLTLSNITGVFVLNNANPPSLNNTIYVISSTSTTGMLTTYILNQNQPTTVNLQHIASNIVVNSVGKVYYTTTNKLYVLSNDYTVPTLIATPSSGNFLQLTIVNNNVYALDSNGVIFAITSTGYCSILNRLVTPVSKLAGNSNVMYYCVGTAIRSFTVNVVVTASSRLVRYTSPPSTANIRCISCYKDFIYFGQNNYIYSLPTNFVETTAKTQILGKAGTTTTTAGTNNLPSHPLCYKLSDTKSIGTTYDGNIIISDYLRFLKIDRREVFIQNTLYTIAGVASTPGYIGDGQIASICFLNSPNGCCFDINGNIYIADYTNKATRRIDMSTGIIRTLFPTTSTTSINTEHIIDTQVDSQGILYSLTPTNIYISTSSTSKNIVISSSITGVPRSIRLITIQQSQYIILISSVVGSTTPQTSIIAIPTSGGNPITFNTSSIIEGVGIAFDSNLNLYVADTFSNNIVIYNSSGGNPTSTINIGTNKPYGIAIYSENLYISCKTQHKIISYSLSSFTASSTPNIVCGTGVQATSPYMYDSVLITNPLLLLSSPKLLSISTQGQLLFTQENLHSVLMIPLSSSLYSIQNVCAIKIESTVFGKSVDFYSIQIYNTSTSTTPVQLYPAVGTVATPTNPFIAQYTLNSANPSWYKIITRQNIASIVIKSNNTDAIGMKVILYDEYNTKISIRNTTYKVLDAAGCIISYNPGVPSES